MRKIVIFIHVSVNYTFYINFLLNVKSTFQKFCEMLILQGKDEYFLKFFYIFGQNF
jgi:hypothetical protein